MEKSKIGLIGLGVMGANLARNIADKEFKISVYNRTKEKTEEFLKEYNNKFIQGAFEIEKFIQQLEIPRMIIVMVKAGDPVDAVIKQLKPLLDKDDIIIDCGNSNYKNTKRRFDELNEKGIHFVGCGVSGGEEGALKGPSMMPGGTGEAWESIKPIFEKIAARDFADGPCVTYIGDNGAGHYVKMVHNGIEYGVMQIMAEGYDLFRKVYNLEALEIAEIFKKYNQGKLQSYLFEIANEVLSQKDEIADGHLIDHILDKAAQKGTGKWTAIDSLDRGIGLSTITEAVYSRAISSFKGLRKDLSLTYPGEKIERDIKLEDFVGILEDALYAAMLISYAQGYHLIQTASDENTWNIDLAEVSRIWEGGCIIRANILNTLHKAYGKNENTTHLFEINELGREIKNSKDSLRRIIILGVSNGVPVPGLSSAISYYDSITTEFLPANFIQGLRDYFGAHTYERTDKEGTFHTKWDE